MYRSYFQVTCIPLPPAEEMPWHAHGLDEGRVGVSEGGVNELPQAERGQEVSASNSFTADLVAPQATVELTSYC